MDAIQYFIAGILPGIHLKWYNNDSDLDHDIDSDNQKWFR